MSAAVIRFPARERVAVLTHPAEKSWGVTTYEVGMLTVLGRDNSHRVVIEPQAERWRELMDFSWITGETR